MYSVYIHIFCAYTSNDYELLQDTFITARTASELLITPLNMQNTNKPMTRAVRKYASLYDVSSNYFNRQSSIFHLRLHKVLFK